MRVAVRSRYTNIHGGYEERGRSPDGRPAFRHFRGSAWIFHEALGGSSRWHFGPELRDPSRGGVAVFFSSLEDASSPAAATWPEENVDKVWCPDNGANGNRADLSKTLWADKDFPPAPSSLGALSSLPGVCAKAQWIPVRQLQAGPMSLFDGDISPNDLLQGSIGDCWLVAAMASLAEFPDAVEALFSQRVLSDTGRCEVFLHDAHGKKVCICIDEFIPCHPRQWWDEEGTPLFARPNGNEAWVLLLEKAFAKLVGSYAELAGGNCCTAFRAFTGERDVFVWARSEGEAARTEGEWKQMRLAHGQTYFSWRPGTEARADAEQLWKEVQNYDKKSFLVACSMRPRHGQEFVRIDGLVEAHAYSLLHAVEVDGHRLLFLRNPWGNDKRWNGRWSDGDDAWRRHPSIRRRLRPEFRCDGAFWIAWVDFQAIFDFVYVCARPMRSAAAAAEHAKQAADGEVPQRPLHATNPRRRLARALPERLPVLPSGARVELLGSRARPELEARRAEIVRWSEADGAYEVMLAPGQYWHCPKCGETNKRCRGHCNVCGGERDELVPPASRRVLVPAECVVLPTGTEVEVDGLRDFPELNGKAGRVVAFDHASGRYHVMLEDGAVRSIRPPHLRRRSAQTPAARTPSPAKVPNSPQRPGASKPPLVPPSAAPARHPASPPGTPRRPTEIKTPPASAPSTPKASPAKPPLAPPGGAAQEAGAARKPSPGRPPTPPGRAAEGRHPTRKTSPARPPPAPLSLPASEDDADDEEFPEFGRWVAPAPEPSHVDEPEPPEDVPCQEEADLRELLEQLDDQLRLRRDVETAGRRFRRGQQLLQEGGFRLPAGSLASELRRGGRMRAPLRLRFTAQPMWPSAALMRMSPAAAYYDAIVELDRLVRDFVKSKVPQEHRGSDRVSFWDVEVPGWTAPVAPSAPASSNAKNDVAPSAPAASSKTEAEPVAKPSKGWAGWVCPECGHVNVAGNDCCESCELDGV